MWSTINSQHVEDEGHVVLFPFMSKGHTIPLLHLSRLFLARRLRVTIFTTPANHPFINQSLADTSANVISLSFPQSISPKIPAGVESTDNLPSIDLFFLFALTTGHMQPDFERALQTLPRVSFMVSDAFLWWTLDSADKLGFPRFVFYGCSNYAMPVFKVVAENRLVHGPESDDELITVTQFPWIKITRKDFHEDQSQASEFNMKAVVAAIRSFGVISNSFYELEPVFTDYWNSECEPKVWCVGPLCQVAQDEPHDDHHDKPIWIEWLDEKLEEGSWVLYVAFGTQAELSASSVFLLPFSLCPLFLTFFCDTCPLSLTINLTLLSLLIWIKIKYNNYSKAISSSSLQPSGNLLCPHRRKLPFLSLKIAKPDQDC